MSTMKALRPPLAASPVTYLFRFRCPRDSSLLRAHRCRRSRAGGGPASGQDHWSAGDPIAGVLSRVGHLRLYVPSINEATHPRCCDKGYPDGPGRASNKEGESWEIIAKPSSESILQNRAMQ